MKQRLRTFRLDEATFNRIKDDARRKDMRLYAWVSDAILQFERNIDEAAPVFEMSSSLSELRPFWITEHADRCAARVADAHGVPVNRVIYTSIRQAIKQFEVAQT